LPPAPHPTEGAFRAIGFTKEITASTWSGNNAPSSVETAQLIVDPGAFMEAWKILRPSENPPQVDFALKAVVSLEAGEQPHAGYGIHVTNLEEKEDELVVHYRIESPPDDSISAQILTRPWSLEVIPKPLKPVVFQKD